MRWELSDLAGVKELAEQLGVTPSTFVNWTRRYATFPAPLLPLAGGPVYSIRQVTAWHAQYVAAVPHPKRRKP